MIHHHARLAAACKALSHPARLTILQTLAQRGTCICGEIVDAMPLSQATVSQHLKVLKDAGLIGGTIDGPRSCYCIDTATVGELREALEGFLGGVESGYREEQAMNRNENELREAVRQKYASIATNACTTASTSCCGPTCDASDYSMIGDAYEGVAGYVEEADLGLGCGLPVEHAGLVPGQTVLDLGSGAGLDAFVACREVGSSGRVIGVDMTAEMIGRARDNAARSGIENAEFRLGEIEHLPVRSGTVDVVISNCVLNLVPDKRRAFAEIHRVLKAGGHFCISDIVASRPLPEWVKGIAEAYAGCVSGAIPKTDYLAVIEAAGFERIEVVAERRIELPKDLLAQSLSPGQRAEAEREDLHVMSVTIRAMKAQATTSADAFCRGRPKPPSPAD